MTGDYAELAAPYAARRFAEPGAAPANEARAAEPMPPALVIRRAADVVEQRAAYLWRPWLPLGSYVDLGGDPGAGKTFLAVELAACTTKGTWPGGERSAPRHVVFLATEDSIELTLKGRLRAAGADMDRITFIEGTTHPAGGLDDLVLDRDYAAVLTHILEVNAGLVYIDALVDILPTHDGKGYTESRQATKLIPRLARDSGAAVLATRHMKKAGEGAAWKQSVGSVAYASRARVMLQVYPDRDDEGRRVLTCCKHNTAAYPASLGFRLEGGDEDTPPHVGWLGEDHRNANQLAAEAAKTERETPAVDRAEAWLTERLAAGPVESKMVFAEGKSLGLSRSSLYRAAAELNVCKETEPPGGFASGRSSTWSLPSHTFQENNSENGTARNSNDLALTFPHQQTETYDAQRLSDGDAGRPPCSVCGGPQVKRRSGLTRCPKCVGSTVRDPYVEPIPA